MTPAERAGLPPAHMSETGCIDCTDCFNCTGCRGCKDCTGCFNCIGCFNCTDCTGCKDCANCRSCKGIIGGRNLEYVAWDIQLTKEEYEKL